MVAHASNTSTWEAEAGQSLKSAWSTEFTKTNLGAGKMAQCLRALVLAEEPSFIHCTHMVAHSGP